MIKESFLKGFFKRLGMLSDDIHRTSKEGIKVKVDADKEVKDFISKEMDKVQKNIKEQIDKSIKPKHLGLAAVGAGVGMGVGSAVTDKLIKDTKEKDHGRNVNYGQDGSELLRSPRNPQYY